VQCVKILGVHGVGNFRPAQSVDQAATHIGGIWSGALSRSQLRGVRQAEGLRDEVAVAYYADLLRHRRAQGPDGLESLDEFERELVTMWLEESRLPDATPAGRATAPLRQALAWLARSRGLGQSATEWFVAVCFREVAAYLRDPARQQVRSRVADALAAQQPSVVIAHSLGSVVAYETLWEHPELRVDLLVTLGSPLALPHVVFPRLQPTLVDEKGARPANVARWVNLADPGDLVAIPPGGIRDGFHGVQEPKNQPIHVFDFHKVANYLAAPQLRAVLQEYV